MPPKYVGLIDDTRSASSAQAEAAGDPFRFDAPEVTVMQFVTASSTVAFEADNADTIARITLDDRIDGPVRNGSGDQGPSRAIELKLEH